MAELKSEFLCELNGEVEPPQILGKTPKGVRVITKVLGGSINGPKIKGEVLPVGADWVIVRDDGVSEMDVRITIKTDDGELIYVSYRGMGKIPPEVRERMRKGEDVDPSEYYVRTLPVFETASEKYSWLNQLLCVGMGKFMRGRVQYQIFQIL